MKKTKRNVFIMSLGCPKNQVDAEVMSASLLDAGFSFVQDPSRADVIVLATCSFLREASQESLDVLESLIPYRLDGRCRCLVLAGCLVQRYGQDLCDRLPQVDLFLGMAVAGRSGPIISMYLQGKWHKAFVPDHSPDLGAIGSTAPEARQALGPWAYVKVAEGCSNRCSYCTIPSIRGHLQSRDPEGIIREAVNLARNGVREINLVAQDVAAYGRETKSGPDSPLADLIRSLHRIDDIQWIRLLYCHPAHVDESLVSLFGELEKLCPYLDLPIQHVSRRVLKAMNRPYDARMLRKLVRMLRRVRPDIALRTTFMVGFPGEREEDFQRLLAFVEEIRFDHVGVFAFSPEEGTPAFGVQETVSPKEKEKRVKAIMKLQSRISREIMRRFPGTLQDILIEGPHDENPDMFRARTRYQAPEVDGIVVIQGERCPGPGMAKARITGAHIYDLLGEIVD